MPEVVMAKPTAKSPDTRYGIRTLCQSLGFEYSQVWYFR